MSDIEITTTGEIIAANLTVGRVVWDQPYSESDYSNTGDMIDALSKTLS